MIIDWHQALQSTENALPTQTQEFYKQFVAERGKGYGNWGFTPVFRRAWSGRWSGRILFEGGCNPVNRHTDGCAPRVYVFSTEAHGSGVRVFVDNDMIIDRWDEGQSADRPGGLWVSTPLPLAGPASPAPLGQQAKHLTFCGRNISSLRLVRFQTSCRYHETDVLLD